MQLFILFTQLTLAAFNSVSLALLQKWVCIVLHYPFDWAEILKQTGVLFRLIHNLPFIPLFIHIG